MKIISICVIYFVLLGTGIAAQEATRPYTLADLNRWYKEVPSSENAATHFLQGTAVMKITDADWHSTNLPWPGHGAPPQLGKPLPSGMAESIGELLERNRQVLPYFGQGARCKESRYPLDATQGAGVLLMYLRDLKQASMMLSLFELSHANAGEGDKSAEALIIHCGLIQSLEAEPLLISQEVRVDCVVHIGRSLEQAVNRVRFSPQNLEGIQSHLKQLEEQEASGFGFTRGLVGYHVLTASLFELTGQKVIELLSDGPDRLTANEKSTLVAEAYPRAADKQFADQMFAQVTTAWKEIYPKRLKAVGDICAAREAKAAKNNYSIGALDSREIVKALKIEALGLTWWRVARTAVALEQFRTAHAEHYPETLSELFPLYLNAVPIDPFDGRVLSYRKAGRGYVLWAGEAKSNAKLPGKTVENQITFQVVTPPPASPK
ncbi:MAG: hypothetical protein JWQ71_4443 [Pedosphaera sp.]|nr:hypothetical protein [Pedosphaera sp.]